MPLKRAEFLCYGDDGVCSDIRKFIEESGVILTVRDIAREPLDEIELRRLIGTLSVGHFLNPMSPAYSDRGFDQNSPDREEAIRAMAEDYTLIRRPIIRSTRLITIGSDKKRISEMVQYSGNGDAPPEPIRNKSNGGGKGGRKGSSKGKRK